MTIAFLLFAILFAAIAAAAFASSEKIDRGEHAFAGTLFTGLAALMFWLAIR